MAKNKYLLYSEVDPFYRDLAQSLERAQREITMMYLIFDHGQYALMLRDILVRKVAEGLRVRLMVDQIGTLVDQKRNAIRNLQFVHELAQHGIEVCLFQPAGPRQTIQDRMHIKICAIDTSTVFVGGSNIGDEYLCWQDSNLKIEGDFGRSAHRIYDFVACHSKTPGNRAMQGKTQFDISNWCLGDADLLLTIPGYRRDICYELIDLLLQSRGTIYFRQWYFLPNEEFMNILLSKLERNVHLEVMLSHRTKVRLVDWANPDAISRLVAAGAEVHRYSKCYMHSKIAWNDKGDIIFGSANLEERGLRNNFELCLRIHDENLSQQLVRRFEDDRKHCIHQSKAVVEKYPPRLRILSRLLSVFSPFL